MQLINSDCLLAMKSIPENSIDLTVTSPPYDNLRTYNGNNSLWGEHVWKEVIKELFRVTKQGGVVVWVVGDATIKGSETGTSFKQALWAKECGFNLHDTMIYHKLNPMPVKNNRYMPCFEYMFVFSKGEPQVFNAIREKTTATGKEKYTGTQQENGKFASYGRKRNLERYRYNMWSIKVGYNQTTKDKIAFQHPAVFPEKLAHDHIISWSKEGDTVLDPFMGSGTTGKMAKLLKRDFIGIELDPEYCKIAEARINAA